MDRCGRYIGSPDAAGPDRDVACGEGYIDSRACAEKRQLCNRDCIIKFPADFRGCNKGWQPTAKGCKCIKPLLSNGICPK